MARITGIGGVFIKSKGNGKALAKWYADNLGLKLEEFGGAIIPWPGDTAEDNGMTVWSTANHDSNWFAPSDSTFMINYRIDDMDGMIEQLSKSGIEVQDGPESHENGRFLWIMDPEGNKIELWEPKLWNEENKAK